MQITIRPMTAEEAWNYILERHAAFHHSLKNFGYKYNTWVPKPNNEHIKSMFEKEKLTDQDIRFYKNFFITSLLLKSTTPMICAGLMVCLPNL